jgi:hypothetical protein
MIAYRLQERAFGGLDRESLRFLDGLARHGGSPRRPLKPGTVLVRDYQGQRHGRDLFRSEDDPPAASQQHHCSVCAGLSAQREPVW